MDMFFYLLLLAFTTLGILKTDIFLESSLGQSRRFRRVVETIQAQLLSPQDQAIGQALSGNTTS